MTKIVKDRCLYAFVTIGGSSRSIWRIPGNRPYPWCVNLNDRRGTQVFKTLKEAAAVWKIFIRKEAAK